MSAAECKVPGVYSDEWRDKPEEEMTSQVEGFATDCLWLRPDEVSYALGPKGGTRKKIAAASRCIVEYAGSRKQRTAAREYMKFLFDQLEGPVKVEWENRQ